MSPSVETLGYSYRPSGTGCCSSGHDLLEGFLFFLSFFQPLFLPELHSISSQAFLNR